MGRRIRWRWRDGGGRVAGRIGGTPMLRADFFVEGFEEALGDGARFGGADGTVVDAGDGDDFGAGAGEEAFVGDVDVVAGEVRLGDGDAGLAGEVHDDLAGDAQEDAALGGRGEDPAVFTIKTLSPVASQTKPRWLSMRASGTPASRASHLARTLLR
jgi:hypothetical protein